MPEEKVELVESIDKYPECECTTKLVDWVNKQEEQKTDVCIDCGLSLITPWYKDLLEQEGYSEQVEKIDALTIDVKTVKEVAQLLDEIKDNVIDDKIRDTLKLYDCMLQTYDEEETD